jgi:hypothetical protein
MQGEVEEETLDVLSAFAAWLFHHRGHAVLDYLGLTRINVRKDIGLSDLGLIIIEIKDLNSCIKERNSEWSYFNDMTNK